MSPLIHPQGYLLEEFFQACWAEGRGDKAPSQWYRAVPTVTIIDHSHLSTADAQAEAAEHRIL